ncbi:Fumarylacetoacetase-like C-terminal [Arabidopsis thaliana x Arabidopsis arenosa]|uniref:Fumarylacetoacetase n=1 Tax=Arabidopsis thaliana x Arabidopsis arenosa TaxID=1240361 RepID=A0A8T2BVD1_9BRAS|nr:Fumarylacetoacetase-like C-terminal [Arabidopsis thaliana x Arabidopsis arenosa]
MALLKSFIDVGSDSHFPIQNLPYGVFKPESNSTPRPAVAIGDLVLDLSAISEAGLFDGPILKDADCFLQPNLNKFLAMGRPAWKEARSTLQRILSSNEPILRDNDVLRRKSFYEMTKVEMIVPMVIGDYTDFFASMHHAKNCGLMFRGPENAINPNWFRLPIAYHGRASSIVISGTDIIRPRGQGHPQGNSEPYFGPSKKLDFELEMAAVVGPGNDLGKPIDVNNAADHIFGLVLMNDWSARDIQAWEYVPLGPFLGKSFGTTVSPWIVTLDALEPFGCQAPKQDPPPLPYLAEKKSVNYDISLEVQLKPSGKDDSCVITKSNFQNLYWTITQQLAHHTVNGCNLRPGDLLGTGTISGPEPDSYGCLLELTWNGQKPLSLNGTTQTFLQDGDQVTFSGVCKGDGYNVGFGTCTGKIVPSPP